jgi:thiol-disulfide isomerase/thioredoxin
VSQVWWTNRGVRAGLVAVAIAIVWPALYFSRAGSVDPHAEYARLDFVLKDMQGKDVRLADYKGRPLLINFWATDCGPCRHEIPFFVELVEKYRDKKLAVLGISTYDSAEELRPFAAKFKMNYPVLMALGRDDVLTAYEADLMIPVTWFVRQDGTVYKKKVGSDSKEWFEAQIKALF